VKGVCEVEGGCLAGRQMVELAPTLDKGGASAAGFAELRDREEVFVSQAEVLRDRSRTRPRDQRPLACEA